MRIIFAGHNERGMACFDAIQNSKHEMVACVGVKTKENGYYRGIANRAMAAGVQYFEEEDISVPWMVNRFKEYEAEILVMAGYPRVIGADLFNSFPKGAINLHASPLPHYRGGAPMNWGIINGERSWAISIIQVDEGIDTGDILLQHKFEIDSTDTILDVTQRVNRLYPIHLLKLLDKIEAGPVQHVKQDRTKGSYYGKRHPRDGQIFWRDMECLEVYNMVRALTRPYPGAFTYHNGDKKRIWKASFVAPTHYSVPGRVIRKSDQGIIVMCKDCGILLSEIEAPLKIKVGENLG